jgi:GR25 family glycosyltransferase involved in LPS biosynthesis
MFDRIALINLDKRIDRFGAFKAKIASYPELQHYTRYRAIHGDTVSVPGFFISGGGAYGCRQSHVRVLEDAMLDGVQTLMVLEDDVCFCPDFVERLRAFMAVVPDDWECLMLGGQNHGPPTPTGIAGVFRSTNTQRTHAYALRGLDAMRELYRLWMRTDRHIDHVFGQFQTRVQAYQPEAFLCGQDEGMSDISGRQDAVRYWSASLANPDHPLVLLRAERQIATRLRAYGLHYGNDRCPKTGRDRGLIAIEAAGWPPERLDKWANLIVAEAVERGGVPCLWHDLMPVHKYMAERLTRPLNEVAAETVEEAVQKIPELGRAYRASKIVWCWRKQDIESLEGLKYHGWHRGHWTDEVTGLDQGLRKAVEQNGYRNLRGLVAQLRREIDGQWKGKILLAHPDLDLARVRECLPGEEIVELVGDNLGEILEGHHAITTGGAM